MYEGLFLHNQAKGILSNIWIFLPVYRWKMISKCSFNFLVYEIEHFFICLRAIYLSFYVNHPILLLDFCSFSYWFEGILYIPSKLVLLSVVWAANISPSLPFVFVYGVFCSAEIIDFYVDRIVFFNALGNFVLFWDIFSTTTYKFIVLLFYIYLNTIDSYGFILA